MTTRLIDAGIIFLFLNTQLIHSQLYLNISSDIPVHPGEPGHLRPQLYDNKLDLQSHQISGKIHFNLQIYNTSLVLSTRKFLKKHELLKAKKNTKSKNTYGQWRSFPLKFLTSPTCYNASSSFYDWY